MPVRQHRRRLGFGGPERPIAPAARVLPDQAGSVLEVGHGVPVVSGAGFDDAVSDVVNLLVAVLGGRREEFEGLFLGAVGFAP